MHILILPSEELVPDHSPLLGIFQADQAKILQNAGYKIGVISIRLQFSLPMIIKAIILRPLGKRNNETDKYSFAGLFSLLYRKLFRSDTFIRKENYFGIPVYRAEGFYLTAPDQKYDYRWWLKAGKAAFELYQKEQGRPDLMHVHIALNAGLLAQEIKKKYGIPYILTERISFFARKLYHPSLLPKAEQAYINSDKVLTVSDFLGKGLQDIFPGFEYEVFPNTVDPIIEETDIAVEKPLPFLIVSIGNLIPLKRHDLLVRSFHRAFKMDENVRLEIIGSGEEHTDLEKLISKLGEVERIKLSGRLHKEEILKRLDAAQLLCHQSEYETFGVAVLEAFFRGVPVIATKCGGPEEVVAPGTGMLIEKDNEEEFVRALKSMKEHITDYDPVRIRNYAIEKYGRKVFLERIENYFIEVTSRQIDHNSLVPAHSRPSMLTNTNKN